MLTIENLFLQIFENKKRIIEQVHNQAVLFDRRLASMCLLEGIAPLSWLLSPSFSSLSSDLNELKKEKLISGLLLPHSQSANPYFSSNYSLYEEPIVSARNKGLPNASIMEVYASNNGTDAGDRLSDLLPFPTDDTQHTFNDVPDLDASLTSPPDCADARISDNGHDHAQSLVKIQRSKSRQRALEDRNSAKPNRMSSNGLLPPVNHVIELPEPSEPCALANSSCVAEANVVDCRGKKKNSIVPSDRITRSRSSISKASTWKEPLVAGNSSCIVEVDDGHKEFLDKSVKHSSSVSELLELNKPSPTISNESYGSRKAKTRDKGIKEKDSNIYVWRITRSKSSVRKINCINECLGLDNSYGNGQKEDISKQKQQSDHAQARFVGPKQLDFDDAEESSWHETLDLALENKKVGTSRKQLSKMQSMDLLDKVTSVDYREKPIQSLEMPLLEEQELLSKKEKSSKDSSEAHTKDNAVLVEERSFNSVQQEMDSLIYQNRNADSYFMASWPQHKRIKRSQPTNALSASPCLKIKPFQPIHKYQMGDVLQSDVFKSPVEDMNWDVEHQKIDESEVSLSKQQDDEVAINLEGETAFNALTPMLEQGAPVVASLKKLAVGVSQGCLLDKPEVADSNSTIFDVTREHSAEEDRVLLQVEDKLDPGTAEVLSYTEDTIQEQKYHFGGKDNLLHCSSGSHSRSVIGTNQNMPEFEGFVMETDADIPFSHFSETYKLHNALNLCHSIPNGLLEGMEIRSTLNMNGDESKILDSSCSRLNEEVNHGLHGRSYSVSLPLSNAQSVWDIRKPCTSPVGKFWDGIPQKSSSSGKRASSIPELPCINEENENADGVDDTLLKGTGPEVEMGSVKREPLIDITENSNLLTSVCKAEIHGDRSTLASTNTEFGFSGTCGREKQKMRDNSKRRFTSKDKENQNILLGGDGTKRGNGSLHSRFSKPKLSGKTGFRKGGPSLSAMESKRDNIVSNITSFIPLVQQKQAAAVITGKRDIKVKALEAAEATKRLAEKKENERKMRKEALKIERAKMEENKLRQLEVEKNKKDEKKKKEADMAAKKRQREEKDKKEKERKKMHVEEAKRHHLEHEKKLQTQQEEREVKFQAPDERACYKESKEKLGKHDKIERAKGHNNLQTLPGTEPTTINISTIDAINASITLEDHEAFFDCGYNSKVMGFFGKNSIVSDVTEEQSYEISPYKGSDDEDEEEDENMQNSKFVPSWASKSYLTLIVSSQQRIDPESKFSFCNISDPEVFLLRRLQQK